MFYITAARTGKGWRFCILLTGKDMKDKMGDKSQEVELLQLNIKPPSIGTEYGFVLPRGGRGGERKGQG